MRENSSNLPTKLNQYQAYIDFYKHYSLLMFRARISIFTLIFVSIGFIIKIIPLTTNSPIFLETIGGKISQNAVVAYITAILIGVLFLLETAYYRRFLGIITCLNQIEWDSRLYNNSNDKSSFFNMYKRRHHEYNILYLISCVFLVSYFVYECQGKISIENGIEQVQGKINLLFSIILAALPVSFLVYIYYQILLKIFQNFEKNIEHFEEENNID